MEICYQTLLKIVHSTVHSIVHSTVLVHFPVQGLQTPNSTLLTACAIVNEICSSSSNTSGNKQSILIVVTLLLLLDTSNLITSDHIVHTSLPPSLPHPFSPYLPNPAAASNRLWQLTQHPPVKGQVHIRHLQGYCVCCSPAMASMDMESGNPVRDLESGTGKV